MDGKDIFASIDPENVEANKEHFAENQKIDDLWQG